MLPTTPSLPQAAMEYAKAAAAAVHPYVYSEAGSPEEGQAFNGVIPAPDDDGAARVSVGGAAADLSGAKELVDSVVVLMQQLTNALQAADDCSKVHEILTYYQAMMARYHAAGQSLAAALSPEDMDLVEHYAQTQVAAFAADLEGVVKSTSEKCQVPVESFIPDSTKAAAKPAAMKMASASSGAEEQSSTSEAAGGAALGGDAGAKIAKLKSQLAWVKRERLLKQESTKPGARAAWDGGNKIRAAVAKEQTKVDMLKATIAALQQEKARLTDTL